MKSPLVSRLLLLFVLTTSAFAQTGGRGARNNNNTTINSPTMGIPDQGLGKAMFLSGKVVVDDGTLLTEPASIQTICKGQRHTETHTDSHGNFSFQFTTRLSSTSAGMTNADASDDMMNGRAQRDFRECELQASLSGFTSEVVQLSSRLNTFESTDIGRVVLHRMNPAEGLTISATSALAPPRAQKAFEKGREQERKAKWEEARKSFEKAVQIYPQYAEAWFELGRAQVQSNDLDGGRHSFEQALIADPKYVSPYRALSELATRDKQWQEVVDLTGKLLALNTVGFPDVWFRNALGNYYLQNFPAAEKSARQGLKLDQQHQVPKMEYLLGLILVQRHQYQEATQHLQQYLQVAAKSGDADEVQARLAEIARLSTADSAPPAVEKK
jgi:tetratricopeptide (TPR) repeat protein